ncbi:MAG: hypothetical protein WCO71_05040 [Pseudomonadota bacterium]
MANRRNWLQWKPTIESLEGTPKRSESRPNESVFGPLEAFKPLDAEQSWNYLVKFALANANGKPPLVDDVTARTINRMQGWSHLVPELRVNSQFRRGEFHELFNAFMKAKQGGQYLEDPLPILKGGGYHVKATRMPLPQREEITDDIAEVTDA